jgi:hypothetical protein
MYAEEHWRIHMGDGKARLHVGPCKCDALLGNQICNSVAPRLFKVIVYSSLKCSFLSDARIQLNG